MTLGQYTVYYMDSGLTKSYPATGIDGNPTGAINYKLRLGTKCHVCGQDFTDGDIARKVGGCFRHELCPYKARG